MGMLANRLQKRYRHLRKWARRTGVTCFRLYEKDIPDQPLIVDWYDGRALVYAFQRKKDETPEARDAWLEDVAREVREGLALEEEQLYFKERRRQKNLDQYRRLADEQQEFLAVEQGLRFWVNLSDYLDTGLFLDHRATRARVRDEASGRHMLNLFCYTASFSVYAAAGGAATTTSVDISNTYLAWAERNFAANELPDADHRLIRDDVLVWLPRAVRERRRYDLIVCDPPTFSNSKKMREVLDVDVDHPKILAHCLRLLSPGGRVYFSTNSRRFKMLAEELPPCRLEEITERTIPEDFQDRRPHRCWVLEHPAASEPGSSEAGATGQNR